MAGLMNEFLTYDAVYKPVYRFDRIIFSINSTYGILAGMILNKTNWSFNILMYDLFNEDIVEMKYIEADSTRIIKVAAQEIGDIALLDYFELKSKTRLINRDKWPI